MKHLGTVYLLHFEEKYKHAQHYLGFTTDLENRLAEHASGRGARLIEVLVQAGIGFVLAQTWKRRTRKFERELKNRNGASRFCPICQAGLAAEIGRQMAGPRNQERKGPCESSITESN